MAQEEHPEKRSARIGGYVRPSLRQFYEQVKARHPNKSMSDVVCEALEEQAAILVAKQKLGGRVGQQ